jgi:hypothetical protein
LGRPESPFPAKPAAYRPSHYLALTPVDSNATISVTENGIASDVSPNALIWDTSKADVIVVTVTAHDINSTSVQYTITIDSLLMND